MAVHTIAGGFSGGGCTASQRKKYACSVMAIDSVEEDRSPDVGITFTKADLQDVVPHDNDPIVISLVTAGKKVHRVLVDQGSSADVMFWPTFNKLQLPLDHLRPYPGCLYGFAGDQVEVRGYVELRTTFTDGAGSCTENIKYLVVYAPSAYNLLLVILSVDQNVGTCLVKGSTCAPLRTSVLLQDLPQEPAKEQSGAAAADRTPTPKSVTEPPQY